MATTTKQRSKRNSYGAQTRAQAKAAGPCTIVQVQPRADGFAIVARGVRNGKRETLRDVRKRAHAASARAEKLAAYFGGRIDRL